MPILLAPMEGLADYVLRDVLTGIGGYDGAVSEFVRVSGSVLPRRTYERLCPEILDGCQTPVGTPMVIQLLGSDPACVADNAPNRAILSAGAGGFELAYIALTQGIALGEQATAEAILERWVELSNRDGDFVPSQGFDQARHELHKGGFPVGG